MTHLPILGDPHEWISIKEAVRRTKLSDRTLRSWCRDYGISRQSSRCAPHEVHLVALEMVRSGDFVALELLRSDHKSDPRVARYYDQLGLSDSLCDP
jgi:hypothetical protein